eukprot:CAMPEP_0181475580 /NCGR_PEP_ID=MMETSP1110-20121109/41259_1 /TAXON_ID=174948 /ORGANISM="Symbiodinium sp., Strain CCMP421" /LENGTH=62 /DNA_ID=CAMNT_0023600825 /DNA_START=174 /DNA_END=365 /DNA_ORIENTATION=+
MPKFRRPPTLRRWLSEAHHTLFGAMPQPFQSSHVSSRSLSVAKLTPPLSDGMSTRFSLPKGK